MEPVKIVISEDSTITAEAIYALIHEQEQSVIFVAPDNTKLTSAIPFPTVTKLLSDPVSFDKFVSDSKLQLAKIKTYNELEAAKRKSKHKKIKVKTRKKRPPKTYGKNKR